MQKTFWGLLEIGVNQMQWIDNNLEQLEKDNGK